MKTTYLNEFINYSRKKTVFVPLGTIEWHGSHLPIETDFLVAQRMCEILSEKFKGYILPPVYLGTDRERKVGGKRMIGMNARLGKELAGSLYYLKPGALFAMIDGLINSLLKQGFTKIYLITGHGGSKHVEVLEKLEKKYKNVVLFNPYRDLSVHTGHADENETSLFWALYPNEEKKSRGLKIKATDDYFKYKGYDPRTKASGAVGRKMIGEVVQNFKGRIKS